MKAISRQDVLPSVLAGSDLAQLQTRQVIHDAKYHADVANMPLESRMRHLVLHFAKYVGKLAQCQSDGDPVLKDTLVDVLIIALSARGALNEDCSDSLTYSGSSLQLVGTQANALAHGVFVALARETGRMAKACEALDHNEQLPYLSIWNAGANNVLQIAGSALQMLSVDISAAVQNRWMKIESAGIA
jgi:hypothetical protein